MEPAAVLRLLVTAQGVKETQLQLRNIQREAERTASSTEKLEKRFSRLDDTVGDFNRAMMGVRNVVGIVKWPALIAGAGGAAQAVGALGAGAVGLTSALAPLAGAGAGAAAGFTALGQAAGVGKLALSGLDKALGGNKKALEALTPSQRAFLTDLQDARKQVKGLQETAASGLTPGLADALKSLKPLFGTLRPIVAATAQTMGELARTGAMMVAGWGRDLTTVGKTNVTILQNLGTAALSAARGAKDLLVVAGPLATWMSQLVARGAAWIQSQIAAGRESGKLAGFLEQTRAVMTTLGHIIANLAVGFWNIGKAAAPLGRELLASFEKLTAKFREWTASAQGQNAIADYFQRARGPVYQILGLFGDVASALGRLAQPGPGTSQMVASFREMVPVLQQVIASTTAAFGPVVINALTQIVRLIGQLAGASGPLTLTVRAIGLMAEGLADMLQAAPGLSMMIVSVTGLMASWKLLSLVMTPFAGILKGVAGAFAAFRVEMISAQLYLATAGAGAGGFKAALIALWAVIRNHPLGILLTVVGLVAGAFALLSGKQHQTAVSAQEVADAWNNAVTAARALRDANLNVTQTKLNLITATKAEADAHRAADAAGSKYGKTSQQAKDADLAWQQAKLNLRMASNAHKDAVQDARKAVLDDVAATQKAVATDKARIQTLLQERARLIGVGASADTLRGNQEQLNAAVRKLNADQATLNNTLNRMPKNLKTTVNVAVEFGSNVAGAIKAIVTSAIHFAEGGIYSGMAGYANGGVVTRPGYFAGEEAPAHPEVILATNPAYRQRNLGLWAQAGGMLGVPGFAAGGITTNQTAGAKVVNTIAPWTAAAATDWTKAATKAWMDKNLPAIGGGAASWAAIDALAKRYGLVMTSGYRPGDVGSYHGGYGGGSAHDYADSATQMLAFARVMASEFGRNLAELIHTPLGFGIKNGKIVDQNAVYGAVLAGHYNHVHVALPAGAIGTAIGAGIATASQFVAGPHTASGRTYIPGWAELSNNYGAPLAQLDFAALGGRPMGSMLSVSYGGRTIRIPKIDVGAGGAGLGGYKRAIDLSNEAAPKRNQGQTDS